MSVAIRKQVAKFDDEGSVISVELLFVSTVLIIGALAGIASVRDAVVCELSDVAGSFQDLNQSFEIVGANGHGSVTHGSQFQDRLDFCDSNDDAAGSADNCITFDGLALDEEGESLPAFERSGVGTFDFDVVDTGSGGSASGTIGDGTIDTGFTITTDTGNIAGTTGGNEIRFRENPANAGTFTISFDEPMTDFEFWVRNLANIAGSPENLLGNFTLTLSDATVINNAAFVILPDAITENESYGLFDTRNNDNSRVSAVTRGGLDYVTDPFFNGTGDQASGRLVFPDIPILLDPIGPGAVGLQSITFDRSGGPNGFQANFSASGSVLQATGP